MKLSRISLVQWHLFPKADLDIFEDAAILGPNRSGKSTLIDLIQTVVTGGSANLYKFNRSAGEGGGRSERTLRAYCLGQLEERSTLRDESWTHIALAFEDPAGLRPPVTVGLCVFASVRDDARIEGRYVATGVKVDSRLFLESDGKDGLRSVQWAVLRDRLEDACREAGGKLLRNDSARAHIREYMRQLFTDRRAPDAERFARTFVMALSFSDIPSVEDFARRHLLEKNDIDIGELRESIQRYRQIQKDIQELEHRLQSLRELQAKIGRFDQWLAKEDIARGVERTALLVEAGAALFANLKARRETVEQLASAEKELERYEAEIEHAEEHAQSLEAQINASDIASQRAVLTSEQRNLETQRVDSLRRLQGRFASASRAVELLNLRERLQALRLGEVLLALEGIQRASRGSMPPDWPSDPLLIERLLGDAARAAGQRLRDVEERRDEALAYRQTSRASLGEAQTRLSGAKAGVVHLDPRTTALMDLLRTEGMKPRALCEVLDVVDEDWRNAAEALLNRDREAIIVAPDDAQRAVEVYRRSRDSFRGCRIVNTRRLADETAVAQPGTLAGVLRSDDPLAFAFVVARLGNVRLAASVSELVGARRAIMRDGTYNDGFVIETRRSQDIKIGRSAAQLMQGQLEKLISDETAILKRHDENAQLYSDVARRLEAIAAPAAAEDRLEAIVENLAGLDDRLSENRSRMAGLLAQVDPALHEQLQSARRRKNELIAEHGELRESRGRLREALERTRLNLSQGNNFLGSWLSFFARRGRFRDRLRTLAIFAPVRTQYERLRSTRTPARIAQESAREAEEANKQWRGLDLEIREDTTRYRIRFGIEPPPVGEGEILVVLRPWVDENVAGLEGNELIKYRRQADEAAELIVRLFRTAFVHELNNRFNEVEGEIDGINRSLRSRPLHGEVYSLRASIKPEFEGLYRLARDSEADDETLAALFGRGEPRDDRHADALRAVERLLQDGDFSFETYQDYRNYYAFDLRMKDVKRDREVSYDRRRGVASGAERQVPFYVVIGSALANVYHGSRPPSALGMGLAVFDEAFSKMDGPNQRTLLGFYREIGLQVVIAAPSEKRAVVYENLSTIVDVHRSGDDVAAETSLIKERARETMRAANPQYLSDDVLRRRLESTGSQDAAE